MTKPLLRLVLTTVFIIPAVAIATATERAFDLGPGATFGVLMVMGFFVALSTDRIVRARVARERERER